MAERKSYDEILEMHPKFKDVFSRNTWDFIKESDEGTVGKLASEWISNIESNINSKRLRRHGSVQNGCIGFGKNKAIVGIGAGKSLEKNIDILKQIHDIDGVKNPDERDFIFIASNHMFKPLLEKGILPDFVFLSDSSDVVTDQLTTNIPESGRNCILLAGLHCSPRVLKRWEKQGRDIRFYITGSKGLPEKYTELTGKDAAEIIVPQGGNVLNCMWTCGIKFFKSTVFMALGNDLSYELRDDIDSRRDAYYFDGDYSSNIAGTGTGRDEARAKHAWMGFSLSPSNIISLDAKVRYNVALDIVSSTGTLWVYKTWIESNVLAAEKNNVIQFMYYNCSEGGICGVLTRAETPEEREDVSNWFLLDDICKRWRTRTFSDAISEFLKAKEILRWGITQDVHAATNTAILR